MDKETEAQVEMIATWHLLGLVSLDLVLLPSQLPPSSPSLTRNPAGPRSALPLALKPSVTCLWSHLRASLGGEQEQEIAMVAYLVAVALGLFKTQM